MKSAIWIAAVLLLAGGTAVGAEDEAPQVVESRSGRGGPGGPGTGGAGGFGAPGGFGDNMRELEERYPEEFAEIARLRESDPRAAMRRMRDFMQEQGIEMGAPGGRGSRMGRGGEGVENGETAIVRPDRNFRCRRMREVNRRIERFDAEAYAELEIMRGEDPEGARYRFAELLGALPDRPDYNRRRPEAEPESVSETDSIPETEPETAEEFEWAPSWEL